ncbi:MAG: hypothetical protein P1U87_20975 [Verrucomicrobiales bacterium]|nr:hypothetical protein [Verrucomicrobiales bacterium]
MHYVLPLIAAVLLVAPIQAGEECLTVPCMFTTREVWRIPFGAEARQPARKVKMIGKAWRLNRVAAEDLDRWCSRRENTAKTFLESMGISFPPGSLAQYDAGRGQLHLLLDANQMELAEALMEFWDRGQSVDLPGESNAPPDPF